MRRETIDERRVGRKKRGDVRRKIRCGVSCLHVFARLMSHVSCLSFYEIRQCRVFAAVRFICNRPVGLAFADAEGGEVEDDLAAGVLEAEDEPGIAFRGAEGVADMECLTREIAKAGRGVRILRLARIGIDVFELELKAVPGIARLGDAFALRLDIRLQGNAVVGGEVDFCRGAAAFPGGLLRHVDS